MLKKIYQELVLIRKELQEINKFLKSPKPISKITIGDKVIFPQEIQN